MKSKKVAILKALQCVVVIVAAALGSTMAWAQGAIESVTGTLQGSSEVVRIDLSQPLTAVPTGFATQSPARIALDFPGVENALGRSFVELNQGNLKSVNVVEAGGRARVVLNLKQATSYRAELQGKTLLVVLDPVIAPSAAQPLPKTVFAENQNIDTLPLKDVDFRRGSDGSGRVIIGLANNQVGVDLRQQGKGLSIDFLRTSLPEGLRRRLDVADFGTPVQLITTTQQGERVRMTIEASGDWEHSAYQSDNQFVIEVRQKKIDLSKLTQGDGFAGDRISLNFQNIDLRSLLGVFAEFTGLNVVVSDTVVGQMTLRLKDVPWDQALQVVLDAKELGKSKNDTVLWIAPKDEINARIKKDHEAAKAIQEVAPLRSQAFQLNYAKADAIVEQLTKKSGEGSTPRFLSERGSAIAEPRTNQLFVSDTAGKIEEVRQLIASLDVAVRQVMIEARIVEARDTFGRSLGVKLGGSDLRANRGGDGGYALGGNNRVVFGSSYDNVFSSSGAGKNVVNNTPFINLPASLGTTSSFGNFALSIFNPASNRFLDLEISAMEADGQGKVVSSPRLITADQVKALIEQGTEFPYSVTAPNGGTVIAFKKAVLKLEVTPQITPEGNIILDLDVSKDSQGITTPQGVAIDTKHVKTQVLIENGGTVVIGGIFEMTESSLENKVPFLGDVPIVGNLFKNRTKTSEKREMLIFITPKVITDRAAQR